MSAKKIISAMFFGIILGIVVLVFPIRAKAQDNTLCGYFQDDGYYYYTFYPYEGQPIPSPFSADNFESTFGFRIDAGVVWVKLFNPWFNRSGVLTGFDSFNIVDSCAPYTPPTATIVPVLDFYADSTTIHAGQCTTLYWNANSTYQQVFLDSTNGPVVSGDGHAPASGSTVVCPSIDSTYRLTGAYGITQDYKEITIYVIQPTNTPIPPTATRIPTKTSIPSTSTPRPTSTSIPPTLAPTATPYDGSLPNDGYEPSPSWLDKIFQIFAPPVEASYSPTDCQAKFTVNNCTWFVAGKRPDVCQWIQPGQGNAYQWTSQAQQNGSPFGISVNKKPSEVGDIVVWSPYCAGSLEYGHVALVTGISSNGKKIDIEEMNWSVGDGHRTIDVADCMDFVSNSAPTNKSITPTPISTPNPVIVPTPSGQPSNPFQWIIDLFK